MGKEQEAYTKTCAKEKASNPRQEKGVFKKPQLPQDRNGKTKALRREIEKQDSRTRQKILTEKGKSKNREECVKEFKRRLAKTVDEGKAGRRVRRPSMKGNKARDD